MAEAVPGPSTAIFENSTVPKSASVSTELSNDNVGASSTHSALVPGAL